jgi:cell division septation protein DedD
MALVAAGIGGALVLAVAGSSMLHRTHHTVPVIQAISGPVRVKPADPGGMKVMGADDAAPGAEKLAPPAERPQIAALRARVKAAKAPKTPVAETKVAEARPPAIMASPPPLQASAVQASPSVPTSTSVQLAAFDSAERAEQDWGRLAEKMPDLLGNRKPEIERTDLHGRPVYRLRTGGFANLAQATEFCAKVRAHGADCSVAAF